MPAGARIWRKPCAYCRLNLPRYGIVALGHSLGGNLVLKFMGDKAGTALPVLAGLSRWRPPRLTWRRPVLG